MKTKLLAMMLLAGGAVFAQSRVSVGVGIGGFGGGFYQSAPPYVYGAPPCPDPYDTLVNGYCVEGYGYAAPFYGGVRVAPRFGGGFVRQGVSRGFVQDRSRGFNQGRNGGQSRGQSHGGRR